MNTTHKASPLHHLAPADRDQLLAWLEQFPYTEVTRRAALPRLDGGLALQTSPAALCRFYTRHARSADAYDLAHQLSQILAGRHAESPHTFFLASLGLLEKHAFLILNDDSDDADPMRAARLLTLSLKLRRFQLEHLRHVPDLTRDQYAAHHSDLTPAEERAAEEPVAVRPDPHPLMTLAAEALLATAQGRTDVSSVPAGVSPAGPAPFHPSTPENPLPSANSTNSTPATPVGPSHPTEADPAPSTSHAPEAPETPRHSAPSTDSTTPLSIPLPSAICPRPSPSTAASPTPVPLAPTGATPNPPSQKPAPQPPKRPFDLGALKRR